MDVSELAEYKKELRRWLKDRGITHKWLAQQLGRSEGTLRNWLYTSVNIPEEMLERISWLRDQYERGFISNDTSLEIGYVLLDMLTGGADADEIDKWCYAADVPEDSLQSENKENEAKLAFWITDNVMNAVRKEILVIYNEAKKSKEQAHINLASYVKDNSGEVHSRKILPGYIAHELGESYRWIPVIKDQWRIKYLQAAAGKAGLPVDGFIIKALREEALEAADKDIFYFLSEGGCFDAPEKNHTEAGAKKLPAKPNTPAPTLKEEDDIPF